jgi:flagellar hook-associated protein 1 FlgK
MYVSSFLSLQTALSGVEAAQEELATTGNNIANENDTDYEDESVTLSPSAALTIAGGGADGLALGTGVTSTGVVNASNQYLDTAYRAQNAVTASANTVQSYAGQLQSLLGEDNDDSGAISSELSTFWGDWNSLADDPGNAGAEQSVVDDGQALASTINQLSSGITQLQSQAASQYENITQDASGGQVYDDVTQLASLNSEIKQATQGGYADNQLLDQRNAVIDDLSSLANVQVTDNSDGTVNLSFGGNADLVQGTTVNWPSSSGATTMGTSTFTFPGDAASVGGTLGALLGFGASGGTLDQVNTQLDGVATQLATSVNALTADSASAVTSFFSVTTGGAPGSAAASLAVNPALVSDPGETPTTASSSPGANDIAVAVAALSGGAPDQAYDALVENVGGIAQQANHNATNQTALSTQITNQRESAEGVDENQEMTNLIQEQQAYEASAKVMGAFSTMMDSLMTVVGQ